MEYTESSPPPALASIVRCGWTLEGHARDLNDEIQPVLRDGCPELVVHLGDAFERVYAGDIVERQPAVLVAGQLTSQLALRATGRIAVVGVRFHPDGAAALLRVPQHELAGLTIGVDEVLGDSDRCGDLGFGIRDSGFGIRQSGLARPPSSRKLTNP